MKLIIILLSLFISIVLYYFLTKQYQRNILLFISSLSFYFILEGWRVILLLFIISITYIFSILLNKHKCRLYLFSGIILNAILLLSYKYVPYCEKATYTSYIPIGLSFYTFQAISYIVDIYKGKINSHYSFIEIGVYLAFFPKLLSGPIERAESFLGQLRSYKSFDYTDIFRAIKIIILALVLKFTFADKIGIIVNDNILYDIDNTGKIVITALLFSFQIFLDFYSYSILAIGVSLIYGIKLSHNFDYPYFSPTIKSFWRRWNITLTEWLRDYIYVPLGGNRSSNIRWVCNVLIVFIISGIWHNPSLNFIIWGVIHGILLIVEHYVTNKTPTQVKEKLILRFIYSVFIFTVISLLWLIFKIEDRSQLLKIGNSFIALSFNDISIYQIEIVCLSIFTTIILKHSKIIDTYIFKSENSVPFILKEILILDLLIITLIFSTPNYNNGFIYFKF